LNACFKILEGVSMFRSSLISSISAPLALVAQVILVPSLALAQATPGQEPPAWMQLVPLIAMVAVFYVLILRPQQKREKLRQGFISALKRGDEVVTTSGILGRVEGMTDQVITLEVADGVRVKVLRTAIVSSVQAMTQPAATAEAKGGKA
jgi:preprotein translocase subunit YajC